MTLQSGVLAPVPPLSRYLELRLAPDADPRPALSELAGKPWPHGLVVGFGDGALRRSGPAIDGLRPFPALTGPGCSVPSTQADIWLWAGGDDLGALTHVTRDIVSGLRPAFVVERVVNGFKYGEGRDLSGYIDGTENPVDDAALDATEVRSAAPGMRGSTFVAVQQWRHDLDNFQALPQAVRDDIIGRRISDNEEMDDAPASAHVKRTAQESFTPEAFVVRRSMPWANQDGEGLMFVAFGRTLDAFEAQMRRMTGEEDGVVDGLFRFSQPITGGYYWCPPIDDGRLDLSALAR